MLIFIADLDNTLIFSKRKITGESVIIEDFKEPSEMLVAVQKKLEIIAKKCLFVPVTTRNIAQYTRIHMLENVPKLAFCSNGGNLFEDGVLDEHYANTYKKSIAPAIAQMENCVSFMRAEGHLMRTADDLFYYTKTEDKSLPAYIKSKVDCGLLEVEFSGEKLYVFPKTLNKSIAVKVLRERYPEAKIIAAGDSQLDIPMLEMADIALCLKESAVPHGILCEDGDFSQFVTDFALSCCEK